MTKMTYNKSFLAFLFGPKRLQISVLGREVEGCHTGLYQFNCLADVLDGDILPAVKNVPHLCHDGRRSRHDRENPKSSDQDRARRLAWVPPRVVPATPARHLDAGTVPFFGQWPLLGYNDQDGQSFTAPV